MSLRPAHDEGHERHRFGPHVKLSRATLRRLDEAFKGFFRRVKVGRTPGFPRFKPMSRWDSFGFSEFKGIHFDGKHLRFQGMPGGLRVHVHREMPANARILSCQLRRNVKGCFQLRYKAESAGGRVIEVSPHDTSQLCSGCGALVPKRLAQRTHLCACGIEMDRDLNAARNILHRGLAVREREKSAASAADRGVVAPGRLNAGAVAAGVPAEKSDTN